MKKTLYIVNVFSEKGMEGGNQLGVLPDSSNLNKSQMQIIAKQLNYSESTFVTGRDDTSCDVRIFLPVDEIDFAGHPTVGTAYVMEKIHRTLHQPRSTLTLKLKGGDVGTYFANEQGIDPGMTYMDQLPVQFHGNYTKQNELLQALGLDKHDIISDEFPIVTPSSLKFVYIPLEDTETLEGLKPDINAIAKLMKSEGTEPYLFTPSGTDGGDVHARLFAPNSGIIEDPATGSAQAALLHAMRLLNLLPDKDEIVVEQGYEMGRPSKLYNRILNRGVQGEMEIQTGGYVADIIDGEISI